MLAVLTVLAVLPVLPAPAPLWLDLLPVLFECPELGTLTQNPAMQILLDFASAGEAVLVAAAIRATRGASLSMDLMGSQLPLQSLTSFSAAALNGHALAILTDDLHNL